MVPYGRWQHITYIIYAVVVSSFHISSDIFFSDINECNDTALNDCEHICNNTAGSYDCDCNTGYDLQADGISCTGMVHKCKIKFL